MPRNNPYDRELTGKRKIISDIGFILTVIFVAGFIIFFIVRQPSNVRTTFDHLETPIAFASGENEFKAFVSELDRPVGISRQLTDKYPTATALLRQEASVYTENEPYITDSGSCIALAIAYNNTSDKERVVMDILLMPYEKSGDKLIISVPERYSVSYNAADGVIEQRELRKQSFRLNFYRFTVSFSSSADISYDMTLTSPVSDREATAEGVFECVRDAEDNSSALLSRGEADSHITGEFKNTNMIKISFNDLIYDYFGNISVTLPEGTAKIGFN